MTTAGIVLAAGRSQRFGEDDKLLADLNGQPLCNHAARAMRQCPVDFRIACISNPSVRAEFEGYTIVEGAGRQSQSLVAGLRKAIEFGAERVLITLADMPNISSSVLAALLKTNAPIAACRTAQGTMTVPAVFGQDIFPDLLALKGDKGARAILNARDQISFVEISARDAFDIDTAVDLEALRKAR